MDREAYWFPPDADDLDKPFGMLEESARDLDRTVKELGKLAKYVSEFKTIGSDKARDQLLDLIAGYNREIVDMRKQLAKMAAGKGRFADLVKKSFHSPLETDDRGATPEGFDGTPAFAFSASAYSYDRR